MVVARSRFRSVRYDLEAAIEVARVVGHAGGSITPDLLAVALGYSGTNNGTYLTRLANAKLFGVVGGRGTKVELTDRGRTILAGEEPSASEARRAAFLAVPLFRAVFESLPKGAVGERSEVAALLSAQFGEPEDKAPVVAAKFLDSARQAGVFRVGRDGKDVVRGRAGKFTLVENLLPDALLGSVVKSRRTHPGGPKGPRPEVRGGDMDEKRMWLDEEPGSVSGGSGRPSRRRRAGVVAAAVLCLAVVAVPLSVALAGSSTPHPTAQASKHHHGKATTLGKGEAEHEVLGALSATTDSGSFDFDYNLSATAPTSVPSTTSTTVCQTVVEPSIESTVGSDTPPVGESGYATTNAAKKVVSVSKGSASVGSATPTTVPGNQVIRIKKSATSNTYTECSAGPSDNETPVTGTGVSNTNPKATLINATVGTGGSGLTVSLRIDSTTLYEDLGTLETSLAPPVGMENSSGQAISSFASITESTIGQREGGVAMIGMASPTGYLDLYQQDIDGASQTGTSTVDGVPVTVYKVAVDPSQFVNDPSITSEESSTATAAMSVLDAQGYTGTTDEVSIDNSGYIREVKSVANFSDGETVVLDVTLSNFGCAGTVLMPGQQGSSEPPSGCTSPDTGTAPTTTTTTTTVPPVSDSPNTQTTETTETTVPTSETTVPTTIGVSPSTTEPASPTTTTPGSNTGGP